MLMGKRIVVVLPAYRAEKTVEATYRDLPHDIVDTVLLVDDASPDQTVEAARRLGIRVFIHQQNMGYGANQKTCYREALSDGAYRAYHVICQLIYLNEGPVALNEHGIELYDRDGESLAKVRAVKTTMDGKGPRKHARK